MIVQRSGRHQGCASRRAAVTSRAGCVRCSRSRYGGAGEPTPVPFSTHRRPRSADRSRVGRTAPSRRRRSHGSTATRAICRGDSATRQRGGSSSPRSCCSRHRSVRVLPAWQAWLARWPTPAASGRGPSRPRRSGPGVGSAIRAGRCGCTRARARSPRATTGSCPTTWPSLRGAARHRHLHGARGGDVRVPAAASGRRHERPALRRACRRRRRPTRGAVTTTGRPAGHRGAAAAGPGAGGAGVGGVHGDRRSALHRPCAALRRVPGADRCAVARGGRPPATGPTRRPQTYAGTDRQIRGALLAILRRRDRSGAERRARPAWPEPGAARRRTGQPARRRPRRWRSSPGTTRWVGTAMRSASCGASAQSNAG